MGLTALTSPKTPVPPREWPRALLAGMPALHLDSPLIPPSPQTTAGPRNRATWPARHASDE
eukprot:720029-Pyramimonas_sp.AAC.1